MKTRELISYFRITSTYVEKTPLRFYLPGGLQDHLHIRGENLPRKAIDTIESRITSTYVEKTTKTMGESTTSLNHLHIRGENQSLRLNSNLMLGSPPHTWRKPVNELLDDDKYRITSTYVEKTAITSILV